MTTKQQIVVWFLAPVMWAFGGLVLHAHGILSTETFLALSVVYAFIIGGVWIFTRRP